MMDITPVSQQNMLGDRYNTSSNLNPTSGIGELQSNLRTISRFQQMIQPLGIDGIYGPETEEAVNTFKKIYHLPTYEDEEQEQYETWSAIRDVAQEYINTQTPGNVLLPVTSSAQLKKLNRVSAVSLSAYLFDEYHLCRIVPRTSPAQTKQSAGCGTFAAHQSTRCVLWPVSRIGN